MKCLQACEECRRRRLVIVKQLRTIHPSSGDELHWCTELAHPNEQGQFIAPAWQRQDLPRIRRVRV